MPCQVITFGHPVSPETRSYLEAKYGEVTELEVWYHAEKMHDIVNAARRCFEKLADKGCDFSGQTVSFIALPGMSAATAVVTAAWHGAFGDWPRALNLIKHEANGREYYAPSPELPELNLSGFRNEFRGKREALMNRSRMTRQVVQARVQAQAA